MSELTADLQKFLSECETLFCKRYTDEDAEYVKHCKEQRGTIPIEERWYSRPPRDSCREGRGGRWNPRGRDSRDYPRDRYGHGSRDSRDYRGQRNYQGSSDYRDREDHRGRYYRDREDYRGSRDNQDRDQQGFRDSKPYNRDTDQERRRGGGGYYGHRNHSYDRR